MKEKTQFCHYFSDFGHCSYEEKTGKACRFSHVKAPVCKFDGKCTREKCMFSHTKKNNSHQGNNQQKQNHFLYQERRPHQQMNLWEVMGPMMEMMQNIPGMWGQQGKNQRRF